MSDNGQITSETKFAIGFCSIFFIILITAFCIVGHRRRKPAISPTNGSATPSSRTKAPFKWNSSPLKAMRRGHERKASDDIESVASSYKSDETLYAAETDRASLKAQVAPPPPAYTYYHARQDSL